MTAQMLLNLLRNSLIIYKLVESDPRIWTTALRRKKCKSFSSQVLVMTAQIFLNILRHSFLKMGSVGLLILDECHHAVKKHPYSLIMQEFYHPAPPEQRPTIFGMTASPVNLKGELSSSSQDGV